MVDSVNIRVTHGELRVSKGAFLLIPSGTRRFLRVDVSPPPPEGLLSSPVETILVQSVKSYIESDRFPVAVNPEHGIPEKITGVLELSSDENWYLESDGLHFRVELPSPPSKSGVKVLCEMGGPLKASQVEYLEKA